LGISVDRCDGGDDIRARRSYSRDEVARSINAEVKAR